MPKDNVTKFPGEFQGAPLKAAHEAIGFTDFRERMVRAPSEIRERIMLAACAALIADAQRRSKPVRCCGAKGCRGKMPEGGPLAADDGAFAIQTVDGLPGSLGYLCPAHEGSAERDPLRMLNLNEIATPAGIVALIARDRGTFEDMDMLELLSGVSD